MKRALVLITVAVAVGVGVVFSLPERQETFPHEEHAGLFPTCVGCHRGVETGDATVSITPEGCANCHDGAELERVDWAGPSPTPSNLDFTHPYHIAELEEEGREPLECLDCHQAPDTEVRMAVQRTVPSVCFECHAPEAEEHYAFEVDCTTCHVTLAQAVDLSASRVADFPRPAWHGAEDLLWIHGDRARSENAGCAVCHARESCERCHLAPGAVPEIAGLDRDPRIAALVRDQPGEWPRPPSHESERWVYQHDDDARRNVAECATCHTRSSCETCHGPGRPSVASALPTPGPDAPQGVRVARVMPVGHNETFFDRHGTAAAIGVPDCAGCHAERECVACHDGVERPDFHPLDFVVRHGAEAFGNRTECSACHAREGFCRDCHSGIGVAASGRSDAAFHDAQPDWLLAHGQAARQDLESCVGCHREQQCLRCHSARTGWRVNPHGPDFDPGHVADKSTQSCAICHFSLPEGIDP